jgi:Asp-tRNA(Asn)/Glu-tRNA(Gln) amidotransferase C subunit
MCELRSGALEDAVKGAKDGGQLTPEVLSRLAAGRGLPLAPERAGELAGRVADMFAFVKELDEIDEGEVAPATVFIAEGA